jgi:hypothetical protein
MPTIRTETDDGDELELEVEPTDIDLTDDEDPTDLPGVQDKIDSLVGKTRTKTRKKTKEKLVEDDDYFEKAAQRRGIELRDDGQPKGASTGEVKKLKKELAEAREKAQRADQLEQEIAEVRDTRLENDLLQTNDGVKEDLQDIFLEVAKDRFEYDEEDDDFYPVDDDGNPQYGKTTEDVVEDILDSRPSLARDTEVSGGPDTEPGGTDRAGKKTWTQEEHEQADPVTMSDELYNDWKTAQEEGRIK